MSSTPYLDPSAQVPLAIRRPTGVLIASLALGVASLGLLGLAGLTAFSGVMIRKAPQVAASNATPGVPQPSMEMVAVLILIMAMCEAALALWGAATVVGLLKLKNWARISIMIIGGLLVAGGLFFAFSSAMAPVMMKSAPMPPQVNMAQMKLIFAAMALGSIAVALVGVWWIVYFLLPGTRRAFEPELSPRAIAAAPVPVIRQPTGPITDFTVAQSLPPEEHEPQDR